jgi:threonine-phosphate decarboxylase
MTATHGGDLTGIGRAFDCDPASLLDFSANINPSGPPPAVSALLRAVAEQPSVLAAYPDPHARELTAALAARNAVPADRIVIANGTAALLDVSVRALATRRCIVPVPAFSEYARALAAAGAELIPLLLPVRADCALDPERLVALARTAGADTCILSNPHNPSGRGERSATIAGLAAELARLPCATIVDEAFVDYAPELSVLAPPHTLGERTIVLRSLTKFFAIPALRIGYGVAPDALAERIRTLLPSWPAGTLEQRAALAVLADAPYGRATIRANAGARAGLIHDLEMLGARVLAPAANFVFFDAGALCDDPGLLRAALIREHGIVIRTFEDDAALAGGAFVRVAVRLPSENARLVGALASMRRERTAHE